MAVHARRQIREAIAAKLTGLPTTAGRVYHGRTRPLGEAHDPTLLIYATEETSQVIAMGEPATYQRELTIAVEGRVIGADTPDDALDQIAAEVEAAIGANYTLGGVVKETTLIATRISTQAPGQSQAGEVRMEFRVIYHTREGAPGTAV